MFYLEEEIVEKIQERNRQLEEMVKKDREKSRIHNRENNPDLAATSRYNAIDPLYYPSSEIRLLISENTLDYYKVVGVRLKRRLGNFRGVYIGAGNDLAPVLMGGHWTYLDECYTKEREENGIHFISADAHAFNPQEPFEVLLDTDTILISPHGNIFDTGEDLLVYIEELKQGSRKRSDANLALNTIKRLVKRDGVIITSYLLPPLDGVSSLNFMQDVKLVLCEIPHSSPAMVFYQYAPHL